MRPWFAARWLAWIVMPWFAVSCAHPRSAAPPPPQPIEARLDRLEQLLRECRGAELFESAEYRSLVETLVGPDPADRVALREYASRESAPRVVRTEALCQLARAGDRDAMPLYLQALSHPDPWMRSAGADCFRVLGDSSYSSLLLHCMETEKDRNTRGMLLDAVIALKPPGLAVTLWERLPSETDFLSRYRIVEELARDPGPRRREDLLPILAREGSGTEQYAAFSEWAKREDDEGVRLLLQAIGWPGASEMIDSALRSLAEMTHPKAREAVVRLLRSAQGTEERKELLNALWDKPVDGEIESLVWDAAQEGQPEEVRASAMWVLWRSNREGVVGFLGHVAADPSESLKVRGNAATSLQQRGGEEAMQWMLKLISPEFPDDLRQKAICGLLLRLDLRALRQVREFALRDLSPEVRWFSIHWLGHVGRLLGPELVEDVIEEAGHDAVARVREGAAEARGKVAEYRPGLLDEFIREEWPMVRDADAAAAWIRKGRERALHR